MEKTDDTRSAARSGSYLAFARDLQAKLETHRTALVAAGAAFYCLLALFPAISAMLAIGGLLVAPDTIVTQIESLQGLVPQQAMDIIVNQAESVAASGGGGLGLAALAGLAVAIYSAAKGVGSLIQGMNIAYGTTEDRGFVALTATKLGLTVLIILGILSGFAVMLALPVVLSFLPAGPMLELVIVVASWLLLIGLSVIGLALLYRLGPSRRSPAFGAVTGGAAFAAAAWIIGSAAFAIFVARFGTYNESFGALAGAVVLLLWLWLSAFSILTGAEWNALAEARRDAGPRTKG